MIIDENDKAMITDIEKMGVKVSVTDIMMRTEDDERKLAKFVIDV
jgi:hypothetical protein